MTFLSEAIPGDATVPPRPQSRRAAAWRGARHLVWPGDQPFWARPALFAVTGVAAFMYAWQSSGYLEIYYAAAVRSMSMSWHNFLYSAFDPAGTVTTDKLPGAFWVQALSVRLFGLHDWALVLPQIIEGALTVLVLFRLIRRLAGPVAGLLAALIAVVAPANVALNRGNVSDSLMIALVVLAANAIVSAILTGRFVHLIAAAVWVGLAFQAKMIEVWLLLPALALAYLVAASGRARKRFVGAGVFAVLAVAVSLSWMLYVTAQPKAGRPYVDGSHSDSVFQQVFDYNGFGRLDQPSPNAVLFKTIGLGGLPSSPPGWNRLLVGPFGTDEGWLLPASVVSLGFVLVARRRRPRSDPLRAGAILWGLWLAALVVVFSVSTTINSYYVAALTPAIAGLVAIGTMAAWELRERVGVRIGAAVVIAGTVVYGAWLLPAKGVGLPGWLGVTALGVGGAAAGLLLGSLAWRRLAVGAVVLGVGVALLIPTVGSAAVVSNKMGSFDTPFESRAFATGAQLLFGPGSRQVALALLPGLERLQTQFNTKDIMATQTAVLAAPTIYVSGQEVYPLGGYNGTGVSPTLSQLQALIDRHYFQIVLASQTSKDPRYRWVEQHCLHVKGQVPIGGIGVFFCRAP
jgi:4-amino-4-deoxy-L-arabinose transferase-like glycosyltransferase